MRVTDVLYHYFLWNVWMLHALKWSIFFKVFYISPLHCDAFQNTVFFL